MTKLVNKIHLPKVNPNRRGSAETELEQKARKGLAERIAMLKASQHGLSEKEYWSRLNHELRAIKNAGIAEYFLIVADLVDYAREKKIPVGPGRGSAPGSLVAYSLGITKVDPVKWGLIFERFFNLRARGMLDIDLDVCQKRRQEIVNYLIKKYGKARVAQSKPARVIISDKPLTNYLPGDKAFLKAPVLAESRREDIEKLGLAIIDLLGLKALTQISKCVKLIKRKRKKEINLEAIPLNEEKTYRLLSQGDTNGVFQMEGNQKKKMLKLMKPENLEQLTAVISLYRPEPLEAKVPELYLQRKNSKEKSDYIHPVYDELLKDTYGLILYQEQVMWIANKLAGFSMNEADIFRKNLTGGELINMDAPRIKFIKGCLRNQIPEHTAARVFRQIDIYGRYAFSKSHAICYALLAYQCAWLKANYPEEFKDCFLKNDVQQ